MPPKKAKQIDVSSNCIFCSKGETDRMVQCDTCDKWYHFECVGVDSAIADTSFNCVFCTNPNPTLGTSSHNVTLPLRVAADQQSSSSSSTISRQSNVQETRQSVLTTGIQASIVQQTLNSNNSSNSLRLQQQSSLPTATTEFFLFPEHSMASCATNCTTTVTPPTVYSFPSLPACLQHTTTHTYSPTIITWSSRHIGNTTSQAHTHANSQLTSTTPSHQAREQMSRTPASMSSPVDFSQRQIELQMEMLEEEKKLHQRFLEKKYEILGCTSTSNSINFSPSEFITRTRSDQMAARQVLPKDLPSFHGDPEEWPLFVSTFNNSTALAGYSNAENLVRLQACLKGKAREIVKNKLFLPNLVPDIMRTLKMYFGRPEHIIECLIDKVRRTAPPKDKLENMIEFALSVDNICSTMEACEMAAHLNNPLLVKELVDKLPSQYKLSWAMHQKCDDVPVLKSFNKWLNNIAEAASQVVSPFKKSGVVNTHTLTQDIPSSKKIYCIVCSGTDHRIPKCSSFEKMSYDEKWNTIKGNKLCRQCLNPHRRKCNIIKECGIQSCKAKHHPLLHRPASQPVNVERNQVSAKVISDPKSKEQMIVHTHSGSVEGERPLFRIVPIRVHANNKFKDTFAFLDEGSSVTLMERELFDSLDLVGVQESLCLRWTSETKRVEETSVRTSFRISSHTNKTKFTLHDVHTLENLSLPTQSLDIDLLAQKHTYLAGLPIASYKHARPTILIGVDNWKLAVPLKVREGSGNQPIATKTRLGWTLQGSLGNCQQPYRLNIHTCECHLPSDIDNLHEDMKTYFALESSTTSTLRSHDERAQQILNSTCQLRDNRYEVGLLWRHNNPQMPNSYKTAYNRLMCLRKKFQRDPALMDKMQAEIDNLLIKGYAKKLTTTEAKTSSNPNPVWYLPIFVTVNPNKPNRIRLVWDAAAKSNGYSLNDFMLTGPDLLTSLVEILLAFRVGKVAVCGDITEMFHRIRVREDDMQVQRFLWWDRDDPPERPSTYVMNALTFGINCAPCIAHYVRNKNADRFEAEFPRAVEAIKNYHYVDDFIDSVDTPEDAFQLANQVTKIHSAAGFQVHNWASNSNQVLDQLKANNSCDIQRHKALGSPEKILGMYWDPNNDVFKYIFRFARLKRDVLGEKVRPTKRETLQVLMSIFDPLGFISCYTIGLKILLQEVWRCGIDWDDELPEAVLSKWIQWKSLIPKIKSVEIPRCYSLFMTKAEKVQIHTFVDAGEYAYAAVCYLRVQCGEEVSLSLLASKSKVAPLKPISIPRLELLAAVLGVRLFTKIQAVHRIPINSKFWWSDSKTVLNWLRMDPRRFQQFVMFRVGEILEHSNVLDWRWVPSKLNTADLATKTSSKLDIDSWFSGPAFLTSDVKDWPSCNELGSPDESEVRRHVFHIEKATKINTVLNYNVEHFSDWRRLYRAVATFLMYVKRLHAIVTKTTTPKQPSFDMFQNAKQLLYKFAQNDQFNREIVDLRSGKNISLNSKLISLDVYLDNSGILRIKSRAQHLRNGDDAIVMPNNHHVTLLIVRSFHEGHHHISHETAINDIRGKFYIPKLRVLFKTVRRTCQRCKNKNATPAPPMMASLPPARLGVFERPFTFVGIDYFGPISIIVGRRREKRWGAIFTCLSVRAVHIEVAHSLDTSSCVMCIRNFISRRGMPREIYSDNGTNFKATKKIFCEESKRIDYSIVASKYDDVKWRFNPPAAPHMGGAWERLVRSIKTILYNMAPTNFNDESLRCALWEIEFLINSRPLTFVSLESCDDEAITPNHLLLGSTTGYKPISEENIDLRQRWYQTQKFADEFWRRWVKEYTPILARRGKWFIKQPPLAAGNVVIIADENLPRNCWPKGIIESVIVAKDGQVRRATVRTQTGTLERPASKIAILDVGNDDSKLTSP